MFRYDRDLNLFYSDPGTRFELNLNMVDNLFRRKYFKAASIRADMGVYLNFFFSFFLAKLTVELKNSNNKEAEQKTAG